MKLNFKSLRTSLFLWYLGSLLLLTLFFFIVVHILQLPYGADFFFVILAILALLGFIIIYRITNSITYLSSRMTLISSKNLDERILDITSENEIGELASTFNSLLDRLDKSFQRERQFIADVAHELKTPLATLKSTLEISLTKERNKEEYKKVIEEALQETDHLSSTLRNVLDLAWSEAPHETKMEKHINLSELMEELFEIAQKIAMIKNITVTSSFGKDIYVLGYKEKLARAILNIIDNAIKYTPKGGKVELILETSPKKALITVSDNGLGISKEDIPHIFDRFYRGSKTDKVLGSGLGLAIAKSIVTLHYGQIKVKSTKEKGSTFVIVLPLD